MAGTLTRWDPFTELGELRTRLDRLFDDGLDGHDHVSSPAIDVVREDGHLVVRADLPGIAPEEVKIEVEDDVLTIVGEHKESKDEKDKQYMRRERRYRSFRRSMTLPAGIDANMVKARTHDGVVDVTIPLPKEAKKETIRITPTAT